MRNWTTSLENENYFRKNIIEMICLVFFIITFIGMLTRHWISPLKIEAIIGILLCDALFFLGYWISKTSKNHRLPAVLLFMGTFLLTMNAGVHNGGIAAPVTVVFIILPIIGSFSNGYQGTLTGFLISLIGVVSLLTMEKFSLVTPVQDFESYNLYHGVMLLFVCFVSFAIAIFYEKMRRNSESKIITQRDFLNNVLNVAPIGLLLVDDQNQLLTVNRFMTEHCLIKKRLENEGKNINEVFPAHLAEVLSKLLTNLFSSQVSKEAKLEVQIQRENEERMWLLIHGIKYQTEGNETRGLVTLTDITEQKFNSFLKDFQSTIMGNIADRLPLENILNKIELAVMDYFPDCYCKVNCQLEESQELISNFVFKMELGANAKNSNNKYKLKEMAEQLVALACHQSNAKKENDNQKVSLINTSKMASIGEIVSIMAHEINNPVAIILGRTELLRKSIASLTDDSKLINDLNKMDLAARRVSTIVSNLKRFSENSFSEVKISLKIEELINQVIDFYSEKIRTCNIKVIIDLGEVAHKRVSSHGSYLNQAFMNLIRNSIDAIEKHSERWIHIIGEVNQGKIILKIVDSGKRIEPLVQEKLMQQFFSTKKKSNRVGLGLSTARGILKKHGGNLTFDKEHLNTCFIVELFQDDEASIVASSEDSRSSA